LIRLTVHFVTDSSLATGTYFRSHNLAVGLTRLGHQVRVFTCDHNTAAASREEVRDGVQYRIVRSSKAQRFFGAPNNPMNAIRRAFQDYPRSDVVHLFQPFLSGLLAWSRQTRNSRAVAWYDWDDLWAAGGLMDRQKQSTTLCYQWNYFWTSLLERGLPGRAARTTTCSTWLANLAERRGTSNPVVIRNGFWPASLVERHVARQALGLDPHALYFGFMGRTLTGDELEWCFEGIRRTSGSDRSLRLTVCGLPLNTLPQFALQPKSQVDALGIIDQEQARLFARAVDIGLVPLEDHLFNWSRFPVRFAHFLAASTPVLTSEIGDLAGFSNISGVLPAGKGRDSWIIAFQRAATQLTTGGLPTVDSRVVGDLFSWGLLATQLQTAYLSNS